MRRTVSSKLLLRQLRSSRGDNLIKRARNEGSFYIVGMEKAAYDREVRVDILNLFRVRGL
jgi:hypothetical protein